MAWILGILMFVAAPIAGLFVARDTLNFIILQTMITILLIIRVLILVAVTRVNSVRPLFVGMKSRLFSLQLGDHFFDAINRHLIAYRASNPSKAFNPLIDIDALFTHDRAS